MLLLDSSVYGLFKWRQFESEVILLAIGWYLRFSLSYRDVTPKGSLSVKLYLGASTCRVPTEVSRENVSDFTPGVPNSAVPVGGVSVPGGIGVQLVAVFQSEVVPGFQVAFWA